MQPHTQWNYQTASFISNFGYRDMLVILVCRESLAVQKSFDPKKGKEKKRAEIRRSVCNVPFFLCEKIYKHKGDVIVGWNRILSLKRSHFPRPSQRQITGAASAALQSAACEGSGPLGVAWRSLEMIKKPFESVPFAVGNSLLRCPYWGANGREKQCGPKFKSRGPESEMFVRKPANQREQIRKEKAKTTRAWPGSFWSVGAGGIFRLWQ